MITFAAMSKHDYICRRCEKSTYGSDYQTILTGRVVCPYCGGTCDPSPKKKKQLQKCFKLRYSPDPKGDIRIAINKNEDRD